MDYKVLAVDDEPGICITLQSVLTKVGFNVSTACNGVEAVAQFEKNPVHAVILDLEMPNCNGLQCLRKLRRIAPELIVIIITAYATLESAIDAMRYGADDYLIKPFSYDELIQKLEQLLRLKVVQTVPRDKCSYVNSQLLGNSVPMLEVKRKIDKMKDSNTTVLITGESGTGKGVAAKQLHFAGKRSNRPFIFVDCSALSSTLIESELFGYEKGAFTGALTSKKGKLEMAEDGTIFLDEITTLPLELQTKLLTVLQERIVFRIGSTKPIPIHARFIAASNEQFESAISEGRFREDLYFRLNVVNIILPPLRNRKDDIPLLTDYFFHKFSVENGFVSLTIDPVIYDLFKQYDWVGNVRELANVIEGCVALSNDSAINVEDIPSKVRSPQIRGGFLPNDFMQNGTELSLQEQEMKLIISALVRHGGHREKTANELGITRRTLQNKIKKMNLNI